MKWLGYGIALLCAFLAIEIIVNAWSHIRGPRTLETKDYLIYVQMLITFLTAILLAVFNFAATRSNEQMKQRASADAAENLAKLQASLNAAGAQALAKLQADLAVETEKSVGKIRAEFAASVNEYTERLKTELSRSSEDFKARLGQTIPQKYNGYHSMFKAATKYFFGIRRLEEGIYPEKDLEAASAAADDAIASSLVVDEEDRARFFAYITESNWHAQKAREDPRPDSLMAYWEKEGKEFGRMYNDLQDAFAAKVRS